MMRSLSLPQVCQVERAGKKVQGCAIAMWEQIADMCKGDVARFLFGLHRTPCGKQREGQRIVTDRN